MTRNKPSKTPSRTLRMPDLPGLTLRMSLDAASLALAMPMTLIGAGTLAVWLPVDVSAVSWAWYLLVTGMVLGGWSAVRLAHVVGAMLVMIAITAGRAVGLSLGSVGHDSDTCPDCRAAAGAEHPGRG